MPDATADPIETIPDPDTLRLMIADVIRQRELLRSLLRTAVRKANWPKPARRLVATEREASHVA